MSHASLASKLVIQGIERDDPAAFFTSDCTHQFQLSNFFVQTVSSCLFLLQAFLSGSMYPFTAPKNFISNAIIFLLSFFVNVRTSQSRVIPPLCCKTSMQFHFYFDVILIVLRVCFNFSSLFLTSQYILEILYIQGS